MRLATWNVNSIRAREERLSAFLSRLSPDVVCLQETKVPDELFPSERFVAEGYHAATYGQKGYNGVAVLSRSPPRVLCRGLADEADDTQARLIDVRVGKLRVVSVYAPNGGFVGSTKWTFKLEWFARLRRWLEERADPDEALVVCGDLNVAPDERDVDRPSKWETTVLYHPEAREALSEVVSWGLIDALRLHEEGGGFYTWWDYRSRAFSRNDGLRLDHVYLSPKLVGVCRSAFVDKAEREGEGASDHAPMLVDLDLERL